MTPIRFNIAQDLGAHLANGEAAAEYSLTQVEPHLAHMESIVLDFAGVRNANSSFMNALISGIVERHGDGVLSRLVFKNCTPVLSVLVNSAIDLGLQKLQEGHARA